MKNLLIYINPNGFDRESENMARIQIDNSIELGWLRKDIILVANFEFSHNGVSAIVVSDSLFCNFWKQQSKINAILYMFSNGLKDELYWFHDLDAFQTYPIKINLEKSIGFTDYGYKHAREWNTGSFFFTSGAEDILRLIQKECYENTIDEELALRDLIHREEIKDYEKINITYNFPGSKGGEKNFEYIYERAEKPVKVLHFHPERRRGRFLKMFCGDNPLKAQMMPQRLISIFSKYGYS